MTSRCAASRGRQDRWCHDGILDGKPTGTRKGDGFFRATRLAKWHNLFFPMLYLISLKLKWFRMHVTWEKIICHLLLRDHCSNDEGPAAGQWGKRLVPPPQRLASPASGPQSKKLRFKEEALTFSETCPMLWVIMGAWGIQLHTFSQAQKRGEGVGSCPGSTAT